MIYYNSFMLKVNQTKEIIKFLNHTNYVDYDREKEKNEFCNSIL
jgi:hypothetical protein